ncbi:MAG: hypothetical protein K6T68_14645 [Alicyclobacillus shizuokensis]|nr:hypothetical protein [Alicyclobacillus shizuokensis]
MLIPAAVAFSFLSTFTGLANGLVLMLVCGALMGMFECAFTPTAVAATTEASKPGQRGFNMAFQHFRHEFHDPLIRGFARGGSWRLRPCRSAWTRSCATRG